MFLRSLFFCRSARIWGGSSVHPSSVRGQEQINNQGNLLSHDVCYRYNQHPVRLRCRHRCHYRQQPPRMWPLLNNIQQHRRTVDKASFLRPLFQIPLPVSPSNTSSFSTHYFDSLLWHKPPPESILIPSPSSALHLFRSLSWNSHLRVDDKVAHLARRWHSKSFFSNDFFFAYLVALFYFTRDQGNGQFIYRKLAAALSCRGTFCIYIDFKAQDPNRVKSQKIYVLR